MFQLTANQIILFFRMIYIYVQTQLATLPGFETGSSHFTTSDQTLYTPLCLCLLHFIVFQADIYVKMYKAQ